MAGAAWVALRFGAGAVAVGRLATVVGAARRLEPAPTRKPLGSISVVIPARDEAGRIGPLLSVIVGAPDVAEVIVVDDESSDATAVLARRTGARVVDGRPLPDGWAGKAWALQQGIESASSEWVVTLDADTRPDPRLPAAVVARAISDRCDLLTVAGRFECPTRVTRWLHAAMLTTLVYRFGPPGGTTVPGRTMANGQCMAFQRERFLAAGAMAPVAGDVVEDIALARHLAGEGRKVAFVDASDLLTVRMFESIGDTWAGWSRSLALPGVEPLHRQILDLAVVVLAQALPVPRLLLGCGDPIDVGLALIRLGTLAGTRSAYESTDAAYLLSPLADPVAAGAIVRGITRRRRQAWRGRTYG